MSVINTEHFRKKFKVDDDGVWAIYKEAPCEVCGKLTSKCDATMLWDGLHTPLCSDECMCKYWSKISAD